MKQYVLIMETGKILIFEILLMLHCQKGMADKLVVLNHTMSV